MTEEVWVHWHGSPPGVEAASSAQQKNFANREEAAIFVMEEISEIDRPSAQMAVNRGQKSFTSAISLGCTLATKLKNEKRDWPGTCMRGLS